ncbi:hypothetical protein Droror1_Dr00008528 [Drosera rotundifolia]
MKIKIKDSMEWRREKEERVAKEVAVAGREGGGGSGGGEGLKPVPFSFLSPPFSLHLLLSGPPFTSAAVPIAAVAALPLPRGRRKQWLGFHFWISGFHLSLIHFVERTDLILEDQLIFLSTRMTQTELSVIESVFKLREAQPSAIVYEMRKSLIDSYV